MAASDIIVRCHFMNDKKELMDQPFIVKASSNDYVGVLVKKIKDGGASQMTNVHPSEITIWKWPGVFDVEFQGKLHIGDFEQKGVKLRPPQMLGGLQWSEGDLLVVQIPGHVTPADDLSHDRLQPLSKVPEKYQNMVIRTWHKGLFQHGDLYLNDLRKSPSADVPFVADFKQKLGRSRTVGQRAFPACEDGNSTGTSSTTGARKDTHTKLMQVLDLKRDEEDMDVNDEEVAHLRSLALFNFFAAWSYSYPEVINSPRPCYKDMVNGILFFPFKCRLKGLQVQANDITSGSGTSYCPLKLLIQVEPGRDNAKNEVNKRLFTYQPRSDFVILKGEVPRLLVEVDSNVRGQREGDRDRLLAESGSIVRFANTHVDRYREEKNFVLVAVYIHNRGVAERFLLYQEKGRNTVYWSLEEFSLTKDIGCLKFARELYNLASVLAKEDTGNAREEIEELNITVRRLGRDFGLEEFVGKMECPDSRGEDSDSYNSSSGWSAASRLSDGGATDELARHGYKVEPDAFKDAKGGLWEAVVKLPPNLRTVYRASDVKKTKLIAKKVRKRSNMNENELQILQYLRTNRPPSPHVIEFIDSIVTTTDTWIIFPKLYAIASRLYSNGGRSLHGKIEQFSWGLIKGLAYLHGNGIAHLDIKPDNLVYDDSYQLKIVDFDVAARVKDEDEEIEGYRGTLGWTAPEVGEEDGPTSRYSPIKADRWSCGRVLLSFLEIEGRNRVLSTVADELTSNDPHMRPSLLGWHKWCVPAGSKPDTTDVSDLGDRGERRLRQDVTDEDDVQAPVTKKPKLGL